MTLANAFKSNSLASFMFCISLSAYARYAANCSGLRALRGMPCAFKALSTAAKRIVSSVASASLLDPGPFCPLRRKCSAAFSEVIPLNSMYASASKFGLIARAAASVAWSYAGFIDAFKSSISDNIY